MKRHTDALLIQQGACNPSAVARSIVNACKEMREDNTVGTDQLTSDPAIRLMVHQLAFLCDVYAIDHGNVTEYGDLLRSCEDNS